VYVCTFVSLGGMHTCVLHAGIAFHTALISFGVFMCQRGGSK